MESNTTQWMPPENNSQNAPVDRFDIPQATQTPPETSQPSEFATPPEEGRHKTLITILLLLFISPIGLILMWIWTPWKKKTKIIVTVIMALLIVIPILVLPVIVTKALDPVNRFEESRSVEDRLNMEEIRDAFGILVVDNQGQLPPSFAILNSGKEYHLGTCTSGGDAQCKTAQPECLNLADELAPYVSPIPKHPLNTETDTTGYSIKMNSDTTITITSCMSTLEPPENLVTTSPLGTATRSTPTPMPTVNPKTYPLCSPTNTTFPCREPDKTAPTVAPTSMASPSFTPSPTKRPTPTPVEEDIQGFGN